MKRIVTSLSTAAMAVFLSACGTDAAVIKHQADAKAEAAKWQAKADIAKWAAVKALAESGSDVGRTSAGMVMQADAIRSGSQGAAATAAGGYTHDPSVAEQVIMFSRELRGWAGLKFGRDVALDNNRTQREMAADQNSTFRFFGQQIGDTARTGMTGSASLAADAMSKTTAPLSE